MSQKQLSLFAIEKYKYFEYDACFKDISAQACMGDMYKMPSSALTVDPLSGVGCQNWQRMSNVYL